jgi:hypothetical protein
MEKTWMILIHYNLLKIELLLIIFLKIQVIMIKDLPNELNAIIHYKQNFDIVLEELIHFEVHNEWEGINSILMLEMNLYV